MPTRLHTVAGSHFRLVSHDHLLRGKGRGVPDLAPPSLGGGGRPVCRGSNLAYCTWLDGGCAPTDCRSARPTTTVLMREWERRNPHPQTRPQRVGHHRI